MNDDGLRRWLRPAEEPLRPTPEFTRSLLADLVDSLHPDASTDVDPAPVRVTGVPRPARLRARTTVTRLLLVAILALAAIGASLAAGAWLTHRQPVLPPLDDVPFFRGDRLGRAIHPGPGPATRPVVAWSSHAGSGPSAPILLDGRLILGTSDGRVVALDALTGASAWSFTGPRPFVLDTAVQRATSAAAAAGLVFISDADSLYALDAATGTRRWVARAPNDGGFPMVADGIVYVGTIGGEVGFDAATGIETWRWTGPAGMGVHAGPVVDGVAYLATSDGRYRAISLGDRSERWSVQTIGTGVSSSEVVGGSIYFAGLGEAGEAGELYAVDRATGTIRWRYRSPSGGVLSAGPVRDGVIFASSEDSGITALRDDPSGPVPEWHADAPKSTWPMVLVDDTLYQQRSDGSIGAYATADGSLRWETDAGGDQAAGPVVSGGMVFQVTYRDGIRALVDPALTGLLPSPAPQPSAPPTATTGIPSLENPFTVRRAWSWDQTGLAIPLGMDDGPDGLLYIADTKPSVTVVDPADGHVVRAWGRQGAGPGEFDFRRSDDNPGNGDVAVASDGRVFVADGTNRRVQVFSAGGTYQEELGQAGAPDARLGIIAELAIGADGSVFLIDDRPGQVAKIGRDGSFAWRAAPADLPSHVAGLSVMPDGSLVMTCEGCGTLVVLDPVNGHVLDRVPVPDMGGDGFALLEPAPDGTIFANTYGSAAQLVIDRTGRVLAGRTLGPDDRRGTLGRTVVWGDAWYPAPVAMPDGRAFTFGEAGLLELAVGVPER